MIQADAIRLPPRHAGADQRRWLAVCTLLGTSVLALFGGIALTSYQALSGIGQALGCDGDQSCLDQAQAPLVGSFVETAIHLLPVVLVLAASLSVAVGSRPGRKLRATLGVAAGGVCLWAVALAALTFWFLAGVTLSDSLHADWVWWPLTAVSLVGIAAAFTACCAWLGRLLD